MCSRFRVAVGLGSNIGNRLGNINRALGMIAALGVSKMKASNIYETPPWGNESQRRFLNACVVFDAFCEPFALLREFKEIERGVGRVPREHWGPRELDVDILLWGDFCLRTPTLSIPHPYMHQRAFVLLPLAQIAEDMRHPLLGKSIRELLAAMDPKELDGIVKITEALTCGTRR